MKIQGPVPNDGDFTVEGDVVYDGSSEVSNVEMDLRFSPLNEDPSLPSGNDDDAEEDELNTDSEGGDDSSDRDEFSKRFADPDSDPSEPSPKHDRASAPFFDLDADPSKATDADSESEQDDFGWDTRLPHSHGASTMTFANLDEDPSGGTNELVEPAEDVSDGVNVQGQEEDSDSTSRFLDLDADPSIGPNDGSDVQPVPIVAPAALQNSDGPESANEPQGPNDAPRDQPRTRVESGELFERRRHVSPVDGMGFDFDGRAPARGDVRRWYEGLSEAVRESLSDQRTVITLRASTSRPGTESYNLRLSQERAAAVATELKRLGVKAELRLEAVGERDARGANRSPMSLRPPQDGDAADARDDAEYRTVTIGIQPYAPTVYMDPEVVEPETDEIEHVVAGGGRVFQPIANDLGELVRKFLPLPENPVFPDPSRDPIESFKQGAHLVWDFFVGPQKTVGKFIAGSVLEAGRLEMQEEVAAQRQPDHEAIAQGIASRLDPEFGDRSTWRPANAEQQALFERAQKAVDRLSDSEVNQLKYFLAFYDSQDVMTRDALIPQLTGASFRSGVIRFFNSDKHFDRE